jgi:hypothetical protein
MSRDTSGGLPIPNHGNNFAMTDTGTDDGVLELDPLTSAVVAVEQEVSGQGWSQAPRLYALTDRDKLARHGFGSEIADAPEGTLIPVEQKALPEGDLDDALSMITWPDDVLGCVLVTEVRVQVQPAGPPRADPAPAQLARLAVGALRDGTWSSCVRVEGDEELILGSDVADDIVTLLLGTLLGGG